MKWLVAFDLDGVLAEGLDDMQAALRSAEACGSASCFFS